ncbi:MAG TPA: SWIM zinc finger family protein, partial [Minicystis sp.]|nr:SWIM zinc finger family protein [Minicystis sp.]
MSLLRAVRDKCLPGPWSQGVTLAQAGAVVFDRESPEEVTARVRSPGAPVPPTVVLYVADEEWSCDCGGKVDPCAHVAAAVIGLGQPRAARAATETEARAPVKRLSHQLSRLDGTLFLERALVDDAGDESPLSGSLATLVARGAAPVMPTHADLAIDRMASGWKDGRVPDARVADLLAKLEGADDVRLDGVPVKVSSEKIVPRASVTDRDGGVALTLERDDRITEVVARGVVRLGEVLHPLGETAVTGDRLERLPLQRVFRRDELGELVTKVLPELGDRIPVSIRSRRLPKTGRRERPRIALELAQKEHTLSVLPLL